MHTPGFGYGQNGHRSTFSTALVPQFVMRNLVDRSLLILNFGFVDHSPGFLTLVNDAKKRVNEVSVAEARARLTANPKVVLLDVREDNEWNASHATEAVHLGKGILERDLEKRYPDKNAEIIMYCGGGFRSVLTCDVAQKLGYQKVSSLIGGYKLLVAAGWPVAKL